MDKKDEIILQQLDVIRTMTQNNLNRMGSDFWGAPLDFGFSDWQGLADMTSWLSRIGFAVMLFANSRRFVYSGGVAGD